MIAIRKSADRGHTKIDWLDSRHTFSFGDYHDPKQMGFRALRVINEDRVRDGAAISDETKLTLVADSSAEVLLFDLA